MTKKVWNELLVVSVYHIFGVIIFQHIELILQHVCNTLCAVIINKKSAHQKKLQLCKPLHKTFCTPCPVYISKVDIIKSFHMHSLLLLVLRKSKFYRIWQSRQVAPQVDIYLFIHQVKGLLVSQPCPCRTIFLYMKLSEQIRHFVYSPF